MARGPSPPSSNAQRASPLRPMEALLVDELPEPPGWQYEPKWDGFRAIIDKEGDDIEIWSKSGKRLGRFFPEMIEQIREMSEKRLMLDGELVIPIGDRLSFAALQARLHPAASRIAKLSRETPSRLILFDALSIGPQDLRHQPLSHRREALRNLRSSMTGSSLMLSPASLSLEQAKSWLTETGGALDGVIAKPVDEPYRAGERAMRKVKQLRTADCVVGGYRKSNGGGVASLLLGLYNAAGQLDLVGFCSGLDGGARKDLLQVLEPFRGGPGFTGKAPGGPSRWAPDKSGDYIPLTHDLVAEVIYDQVTAHRFRHGTRFHRWRPDKDPEQCTLDQLVREIQPKELIQLMGKG
ncbi:ATP-dependent DNA ligase [Novosphingobium sp. JCM 18896]|uniref:ATP-dependent DNA ligase n=1 Tax=Novosphingobium sp. JCM 18896 TaxID=2989731 RepID=UPI002221872E|nr:ATP-dependent DNA ligase [Novosphingobium sp. JCM 18896]MCW1432227.1 ATP-dependent DNA ligase [Novosphingobium sp. JCM 18896]